jgi:hypothetical protein
MLTKKAPALVQGYGMREHAPHLGQLHPGGGDEVVSNAKPMLAVDEERMLKQQIEMLGYRTRKGVLYGDHRCLSSL